MSYLRLASMAIAMLGNACSQHEASAPRVPVTELSVDHSALCEQVADRFVGLPAMAGVAGDASGPRPLVGRWWLRGCSATRANNDLRVRIQGPGWYFVDKNDGNVAIHQQVPFDLSIELDGHVNLSSDKGVVSLWFAPAKEAKVDLRVSGDLDVRPTSAWGSFLSVAPLVPLQEMVADRFVATASDALRDKLRDGATVTYDIGAGQADATLGRLGAGQAPVNAFQDRIPWLVNDRLFLDAAAVHVLGPIAPGPTRLDVTVEQGSGATYRAVCVEDMAQDYPALARGDAAAISSDDPQMAHGTVAGPGKHTTDFRVDNCKFYLVVAALEPVSTVVSLRIRA
jgi:hypothetical protein